MVLDLDPRRKNPLYLQIKEGLAHLIREGLLPPGSRLPASRELAASQGVSRNTVMLAYEELAAEGLIESHVGRGAFVCRTLPRRPSRRRGGASSGASEQALAGLFSSSWSRSNAPLLAAMEHISGDDLEKEGICFASTRPDSSLLPLEQFRQSLASSFRRFGSQLLAAGSPSGFAPLLDYLPSYLARRNVACQAEDLMIASGVQQGLSLVGRLFLDPGDTVLLENLTYPGALAVFRSLQATCIGIPVDSEGICTDVLQTVLRRRAAKLLYTIPTFHNPTGSTLPPQRRKRLIELCREHGVMIVEDDFAHELAFEGRETLPLKAWDSSGTTVYLGSFSESLFPGIRLCWILAPRPVIERLQVLKRISDLSTSSILQGALLEFCRNGHLDRLLKRKRRSYRARRDLLLEAMKRHFPGEATWRKACGGLYQWVDLPQSLDSLELLLETRKQGVVFAPDRMFSVEEWQRGGFRLGFADVPEQRIEEGIRVIGEAMKSKLARSRSGRA